MKQIEDDKEKERERQRREKESEREEVRKNYWIGYESILAHHFPEGRDMGMPGWNGHHHRHFVSSHYSPIFKSYEWHQLGCGHRRAADYCAGERWNLGFILAHVDTYSKHSLFEYAPITDHAVIGGKWYVRTPDEFIHAS